MPDVTPSIAPTDVRVWVALDVHKFSIVAAVLPPSGGTPELIRIETTDRAIWRFIDRLDRLEGLAVAYEAGPGGYTLRRLLAGMGVGCDIIAPSRIPVRAGDRVKTDRRDAKKLVLHLRVGELGFVSPPTTELEGLRDLLRCRDDIRCARTAAHHRGAKQLLRQGLIYREGTSRWTLKHRAWIVGMSHRSPDPRTSERIPLGGALLAVVTGEGLLGHVGPDERGEPARDRDGRALARRGEVSVAVMQSALRDF